MASGNELMKEFRLTNVNVERTSVVWQLANTSSTTRNVLWKSIDLLYSVHCMHEITFLLSAINALRALSCWFYCERQSSKRNQMTKEKYFQSYCVALMGNSILILRWESILKLALIDSFCRQFDNQFLRSGKWSIRNCPGAFAFQPFVTIWFRALISSAIASAIFDSRA